MTLSDGWKKIRERRQEINDHGMFYSETYGDCCHAGEEEGTHEKNNKKTYRLHTRVEAIFLWIIFYVRLIPRSHRLMIGC
jgi:hypothetical protein